MDKTAARLARSCTFIIKYADVVEQADTRDFIPKTSVNICAKLIVGVIMKAISIPDDKIIEVCNKSKSMFAAANVLGISMTTLKRKATRLGCYKKNQGGKGIHKKSSDGIPLADILAGKYPTYQTYKLKLRLINEGIKADKCELCGWDKKATNAKYSACELHHKDGNPSNHKLENLLMVCPNCHSLTATYRFRKRVPKEKSLE